MNRTYNEQIDNGLFVVEYYLDKNYKDITTEDLKNNVDKFAELMWSLVSENDKTSKTSYYRLSTQSHNNSFLNQYTRTQDKIKGQLEELLNNTGNDKTCMCCGEKTVNADYLPDNLNVFMAGLPSVNNFFNKANNLQTVDICPVCLFLSYISFLNTQKISYPFLYLSDSDVFMRDITNDIQNNVQANELLDIKKADLDKHFVDTMSKLMQYELIYDDMNYTDLIFFQNGKVNYYEEQSINKKKILFLLKLKNKGLINEFYELRLFNPLLNNKFLISFLIDKKKYKLRCSKKMLAEIKEETMSKEEINIIEYATNKLLEDNCTEEILKELKLCNNKNDFEKFVIGHSEEEPIYESLDSFVKLTDNHYKYKNVLIANLLLNNKEEC